MSSPLSFIVKHENTILATYEQNNAKPKDTWASLEQALPQLSQKMTFNTFRQYMPLFAFMKAELDKVRRDRVEHLKLEKKQLNQQLRDADRKLDKVIQNRDEILKNLAQALEQKARLETELKQRDTKLDSVRQENPAKSRDRQKLDNESKRIRGWSVQHSKDGYYRCYRKIDNRLHSVYLGKQLDVRDAENRIISKEKSLGLI